MRVRCTGCDSWHDLSPTSAAIVIDAFQAGDLTHVGSGTDPGITVTVDCLLGAFDDERIADFKKRYKGNEIIVDGHRK